MPDEKTATVDVTLKEAPDKKQEYLKERDEAAKECTEKFQKLLQEYNCFPEINMQLSTSGKISGTVVIRPRI